MPEGKYNLPSSSLSEIEKIIMAYAHANKECTLDDIAKLIGMHRTTISKNNPFLTDSAIIEGGRAKRITDIGIKLARASEHNQIADSRHYLIEVVGSSDFLSSLITTVRIKGGMSTDELVKHALYASGQSSTAGNRTGAKTVVELLTKGALLTETDGTLQVSYGDSGQSVMESDEPNPPIPKEELPSTETQISASDTVPPRDELSGKTRVHSEKPSIAINIQLQIPESDNPEVYDLLFRALRKHLLDQNNDE